MAIMKAVGVDTTLLRPKVLPPEDMSKASKGAWEKLVNSVPNDHFNDADFVVLRAYCEAYSDMVDASTWMEVEGKVLFDGNSKSYINPWFTIYQQSSNKIASLAIKLRLCPSARQRIDATKEKANQSIATSKLGAMIKR